jgi:MoaA/NifB/PqqE/SkfB family radical SAM enzyme
MKDIGFGITLSDRNAHDLLMLHSLADWLGIEFATAAVHNSFYFHKYDNVIKDKNFVAGELLKLSSRQLKSNKPKDWFRAYFNAGLAEYVQGRERLLPCGMGTDVFFVDPYGEIMPCNALNMSMGNIRLSKFEEIWNSEEATKVRKAVSVCKKNCWMVGSAAIAMKKHLSNPMIWIIKKKLGRSCFP